MTTTVDEVTDDELGGELRAGVLAVKDAIWREREPDEPGLTDDVAVWMATASPPGQTRIHWVASAGDTVLGLATLQLPQADNRTLAKVLVEVLPAHRRQGVGRALLRPLVERARAEGRTTLAATTFSRAAGGAAFATSFGASVGLVERVSELDLRSVDRDLLRRWIAQGEAVAGYEPWAVEGPYPPEEYGRIAAIQAVMATAPTDDLDVEPPVWTADRVAEGEAKLAESPGRRHALFVRHVASGDLVALTRVWSYETWPGVLEQGDTCVDPAHRGQGLGKWAKAAMIERMLERWPDLRKVRTQNAFSNGAMLAINDALGFRVVSEVAEWQVATDRVAGALH